MEGGGRALHERRPQPDLQRFFGSDLVAPELRQPRSDHPDLCGGHAVGTEAGLHRGGHADDEGRLRFRPSTVLLGPTTAQATIITTTAGAARRANP
jgi:hypothetical protein